MIIVDITDIESLILTKCKIDEDRKKAGEIKEKTKLEDFYKDYVTLSYSYLFWDKENNEQTIIPFGYITVCGMDYLFISNIHYTEKIKPLLIKIKENSLKKISIKDIINNMDNQHIKNFESIIINGEYYSIN